MNPHVRQPHFGQRGIRGQIPDPVSHPTRHGIREARQTH